MVICIIAMNGIAEGGLFFIPVSKKTCKSKILHGKIIGWIGMKLSEFFPLINNLIILLMITSSSNFIRTWKMEF